MPDRIGFRIDTPTEPSHVVQASVDIAAPPDAVFRALAEPEELAAWLGGEVVTSSRADAAPVLPGGSWRVPALAPDGSRGTVGGEYLRVDPPRRLESTWRTSWNRFATEHVRFELVPIDVGGVSGTRVTVTHTRAVMQLQTIAFATHPQASLMIEAWSVRLERLAIHLAASSALAAWGVPHYGAATFGFEALHRAVVAIHQGE